MEFIPGPVCPAVLLAQVFCNSKNGGECATDGRRRQREAVRCDGQSETELKIEREKRENTIHMILPFVTKLRLTTHARESITWLLQRCLISTIPAKMFHEIRVHYTLNCTAEADAWVFVMSNKWLGRWWAWRLLGSTWVSCTGVLSCYRLHEQTRAAWDQKKETHERAIPKDVAAAAEIMYGCSDV